jgi:hypothetical protein
MTQRWRRVSRLTQLINQGRCLLDGCKVDAMDDCVATAPHTNNDANSKKNNALLKSFTVWFYL